VLAVGALAMAAQAARGQDMDELEEYLSPGRFEPFVFKRDTLPVGKHAFFFLPPKSPVLGRVTSVSWSPNGRFCIVEVTKRDYKALATDIVRAQKEGFGDPTTVIWLDVEKDSSRVMFEQQQNWDNLPVAWSADCATVYLRRFGYGEDDPEFLSTFRNGVAEREVKLPDDIDSVAVEFSTGRIAAVVYGANDSEPKLLILDASGVHPIRDAQGETVRFYDVSTIDNRVVAFWDKGKKVGRIDFDSRQIVEAGLFKPAAPSEAKELLEFGFTTFSSSTGLVVSEVRTDRRVKPPTLLLAAEVEEFWPSPAENAIAYTSQGILVIREIVKGTRAGTRNCV